MGKKQHQQDKLYLTTTEWAQFYGGHKSHTGKNAKFRRLPFSCCSISLQPFENPMCTKEGVVFDLLNIYPFLKKFGKNPVTGEPMSTKDLIKLNFFKNAAGKYHCPVTFRVFNENTHIVAIRTTGNVYAYEAVERLNIKPGYWKDLQTDEPFVRKDIITIQDPTNLDKFNLANFYHLKHDLKVISEEEELEKRDPKHNIKTMNAETRGVLAELDAEYKSPEVKREEKKKADSLNAAHYSSGRVAASFTSTAVDPQTEHEAAIIDEDVLKYERVKKKGYVRIMTNKGMLNIELHSDMVPKVCENFILLCGRGYYKGTTFHRSIRNFMIQGGDPDGTGHGGESAWGKAFKDHFKPNLTHTGRGVLSMANSGPDTNKSQFFITYRSCRHLDNKHSVFGRIVGGIDTLDKMERVKTDSNDKPQEDIVIEDCQIFVNPFEEAEEELKKERDAAKQKETAAAAVSRLPKTEKPAVQKVYREGIGKYINPVTQKRTTDAFTEEEPKKKKNKVKGKYTFDNFSSW